MSKSSKRLNNSMYEFACNLTNEKINKLLYKLFNEEIVVVNKEIYNRSSYNQISWTLSKYNLTLFLKNIENKLSLRNKNNKVLSLDTIYNFFINEENNIYECSSSISNKLKTFINSNYDAEYDFVNWRIKYFCATCKVILTNNFTKICDVFTIPQKRDIFSVYYSLNNRIYYDMDSVNNNDINQMCSKTFDEHIRTHIESIKKLAKEDMEKWLKINMFLSDEEPTINIIDGEYYLVFKYNRGICGVIKEFYNEYKNKYSKVVFDLIKELQIFNKLTEQGCQVKNNIIFDRYNFYMSFGNIYKKAVFETVEIAKERNKIMRKKEKKSQYLHNLIVEMNAVGTNPSEIFLKQIYSYECLKNPSLIEFIDKVTEGDEIIKKILLIAIDAKKINKDDDSFEILYKNIQIFFTIKNIT